MIDIDDDAKDYAKKVYRALPVLQRLVREHLEKGSESGNSYEELENLDWLMDEVWSYFDHTYMYGEQWMAEEERAEKHK